MSDAFAEQRIRAARGRLAFLRPYFDRAIYSHVLIEEPRVGTVAVDRWKRIYYAPAFIRQYSVEQLVPCLMHELGHSLREHHRRADSMGVTHATAAAANIAQDCELNDDIRDEVDERKDMPHLPKFAFYPSTIGAEDGKLWEHYYQKMLSEMPEMRFLKPGGEMGSGGVLVVPDCGSGAHGAKREWEHGDPGIEGNAEGVTDADWGEIKQITAEKIAARQKSRGDVAGSWVEWASDLLRPRRIPWDQELAGGLRWAVASVAGMVMHSYARPSRRASALPDFIQPSMRRPQPFVCIVGDTSGSMDVKHDLALVRGVTEDICQAMGARVAFLATDAGVHGGVQKVTSGRNIELKGRGGTNMSVGIEYAMTKLRPKPDVVVVATDCGTGWPSHAPRGAKVIVCAIGNDEDSIARVPKWARLIRVDPDNTTKKK